jgi:type III secretion system FlhB-like substrate exporter
MGTKKAIAVKYNADLPAPFVIAKGKDSAARKLISIAEAHNIHITNEEDLADRLFLVQPGDFIPEEIYEIVAEILAYVYMTQSKLEIV